MTNLLKAISNIAQLDSYAIVDSYKSSIRIQNAGESLEYFIKDAFSGAFNANTLVEKEALYQETFSYFGSANHPPDMMIKQGDAIEVKKIQTLNADIALNSSYPKNKLYADSNRIKKACRECEDWVEKDIIYAIGTIKAKQLISLWFVYGSVYAADGESYEQTFDLVSAGLNDLHDIQFSKTNELGRVNKVDPLGITHLRIRGMWGIEHPIKLFKEVVSPEKNIVNAIVPEEKYFSFPKEDILILENNPLISLKRIMVKNPNNPAQLLNAMQITVGRKA